MIVDASHIRQGHGSVRPYLYGPLELLEFVRQVFGAIQGGFIDAAGNTWWVATYRR
jgi:hypothetical protein